MRPIADSTPCPRWYHAMMNIHPRTSLFAMICVFALISVGVADQPAPSAPRAPAAHPSDHPGRLAPGDLLVVSVSDLGAVGESFEKPVRIAADGTIKLHYIAGIKVGGLTHRAAQDAIALAYRKAVIVQNATVYIRRIQVAPDALPFAPVGRFDLVRVTLYDLRRPGGQETRILRIDGDGNIDLPYQIAVKAAGMTEPQIEGAISAAYDKANLSKNMLCSVLRLEAAPPDAEHMDLPDAPLKPLPEVLKPWCEITPEPSGK